RRPDLPATRGHASTSGCRAGDTTFQRLPTPPPPGPPDDQGPHPAPASPAHRLFAERTGPHRKFPPDGVSPCERTVRTDSSQNPRKSGPNPGNSGPTPGNSAASIHELSNSGNHACDMSGGDRRGGAAGSTVVPTDTPGRRVISVQFRPPRAIVVW